MLSKGRSSLCRLFGREPQACENCCQWMSAGGIDQFQVLSLTTSTWTVHGYLFLTCSMRSYDLMSDVRQGKWTIVPTDNIVFTVGLRSIRGGARSSDQCVDRHHRGKRAAHSARRRDSRGGSDKHTKCLRALSILRTIRG